MNPRRRVLALLACVVVGLAVAWYAGSRAPGGASGPPPAVGAVRLGPEPGQDVAGYLAGLPARLPPAGAAVPALVQFTGELTPDAALGAVAGTVPHTAVFHVPLPRVQTALRFEPLEPGVPPPTALGSARDRAQLAALADARRAGGRPGAVAAAEAEVLARPACRCVLAVLVVGDRAGLQAVAVRPGVRAVDPAPPGTTVREVALAPLLPVHEGRVGPVPDDGPVPPAPGR
ncbi:MAG TPA: hypothetical protein VM367_02100 [Pseudonocardia sp.]|nr:hypothetical protein [Pseudonocardia sp.]